MTFHNIDEKGHVALVTGGSSGIGREFCKVMHKAGANIAIVDLSEKAGKDFSEELNKERPNSAIFCKANAAIWEEQKLAFETTLETWGRIDYVGAIAGIAEKPYISPEGKEFVEPNLTTLNVNLNAVIYSCTLGVQAFRRQQLNRYGFKGKLILASSVCGFYVAPGMPMYTTSKHGVTGYVKSVGATLPKEGITCNAICPLIVKSNLATSYDDILGPKNLFVPMECVQKALTSFVGPSKDSGLTLELSPEGKIVQYDGKPFLDEATEYVFGVLKDSISKRFNL